MKHFSIKSPSELTDEEKKTKARFDAVVKPLQPHDHIEHSYILSNGEIRLLALICIEQGHMYEDERYLIVATYLLSLFVREHPDLRPHIDEMLEVLGVLDKSKSR